MKHTIEWHKDRLRFMHESLIKRDHEIATLQLVQDLLRDDIVRLTCQISQSHTDCLDEFDGDTYHLNNPRPYARP